MKKNLLYIVSTVALLFLFSESGFAKVNPTLGVTRNFVLFTTAGAMTNEGTSNLNGFIGTNGPGISTGFETATGTFSIHDADPQAAADLTILYNQLNAATLTGAVVSTTLGGGLKLEPGVYQTGAATNLTGQLILDGKGDSRAEFVIKIGGAFSTLPNSEIVLMDGANACNIYWVVEGAVSMAAQTKMKGTIVSHNGAIEMLFEGVNLEGRALTTNGAVYISNATAFVPDCSYILTPVINTQTSSVAVFSPNPMNGSVVLTLADATTDNRSQLKIYNALGRVVVNKTIANATTTIETNFPTGVYFYKLIGKDNKVQTGKLMSK